MTPQTTNEGSFSIVIRCVTVASVSETVCPVTHIKSLASANFKICFFMDPLVDLKFRWGSFNINSIQRSGKASASPRGTSLGSTLPSLPKGLDGFHVWSPYVDVRVVRERSLH